MTVPPGGKRTVGGVKTSTRRMEILVRTARRARAKTKPSSRRRCRATTRRRLRRGGVRPPRGVSSRVARRRDARARRGWASARSNDRSPTRRRRRERRRRVAPPRRARSRCGRARPSTTLSETAAARGPRGGVRGGQQRGAPKAHVGADRDLRDVVRAQLAAEPFAVGDAEAVEDEREARSGGGRARGEAANDDDASEGSAEGDERVTRSGPEGTRTVGGILTRIHRRACPERGAEDFVAFAWVWAATAAAECAILAPRAERTVSRAGGARTIAGASRRRCRSRRSSGARGRGRRRGRSSRGTRGGTRGGSRRTRGGREERGERRERRTTRRRKRKAFYFRKYFLDSF